MVYSIYKMPCNCISCAKCGLEYFYRCRMSHQKLELCMCVTWTVSQFTLGLMSRYPSPLVQQTKRSSSPFLINSQQKLWSFWINSLVWFFFFLSILSMLSILSWTQLCIHWLTIGGFCRCLAVFLFHYWLFSYMFFHSEFVVFIHFRRFELKAVFGCFFFPLPW